MRRYEEVKGPTPISYADLVANPSNKKLNFRTLASPDPHDDCDVVLPKDSIRVVQDKLANTLYGYFLGDRVAYPVVEYYVKNKWKRFGLVKPMMNANGFFFFFKFADHAGMMVVLKEGPWVIRSQPLFLCEWSPNTKLVKKEVKNEQLWVRIHDVPLAAYTEDGLSLIVTAIGVPKLLDSYTTSMCMDSWGRSSYARALIEVSADKELKKETTMAIPKLDGDGYVKETMYVEYEWNPHRCSHCCVFGHSNDQCPSLQKNVVKDDKSRKPPVQGRGSGKKPMVDEEGYMGVQAKCREGQCSKDAGGEQEDSEDEEVVEVYNETGEFIMEGTHKSATKGTRTPNPLVSNESHVDVAKLSKVCSAVFRHWDWTSNRNCCVKGTRIIIGWNPEVFDVMILSQSSQVVHLQLVFKDNKRILLCSVVYTDNYYVTRRELWAQLSLHKLMVADKPWVIMGDFNSALYLEDKSMGTSATSVGMRDFQASISDIEVMDVNRSGLHFTSTQKPKKGIVLLKKIDRVMANDPFVADFPNSPDFMNIVKEVWDTRVNGVYKFRVVKKLRHLKSPLRALLFRQGNLHTKVIELHGKLDDIQKDIDKDPMNTDLRARETKLTSSFQEACLDEERFLKQKAKMDWLRAGDANTAYFHAAVKSRNHWSRIQVISDANGVMYEADNVHSNFVQHYEKFLGCQDDISVQPTPDFFSKWVNPMDASYMVRPVMMEEVKSAMFSIGNDKASGPDGYTAAFFKAAWSIVGHDISKAVIDFFSTGRKISDNILLTQELMHNYHRNSGPPRCAFKVDIQKAYDTVDWSFLKKCSDWVWVSCQNGGVDYDDLFLFARGDVNSAKCIMSSPTIFTKMSGLVPSIQKGTGFFCNVPTHVKDHILDIMPFEEGSLPVRYLGVPLISSRLLYKDSSALVESYSLQVWNMVHSKGGMDNVGPYWDDIVD
ncbi:uncharacterized protein LOC110914476 [Helianthus annuus]|uniref:uncharacterized protein LOC110914476 n=1 Tax=Helianthus annuus TaxID=4232 RepID=UPI000B905185|nr:uncharacterized protein LOC110914476 [Helianthus annuus]